MFSGLFSKRATNGDTEISYDDLADALKRGACFVVDVREPQEFASGHVPGAVNQPLSRFDPKTASGGKAGRAHLSGGRAIGEGAQPGAIRRTQGRPPLCRRHGGMAPGRRRRRSLAAFTWGTAAAPGDPSGSVIRFVLRPSTGTARVGRERNKSRR